MVLILRDIAAQPKEFRQLGVALLAGVLLFTAFNWIGLLIFNSGLCRYYCLEPAKVLCIGHSMSEMGIDRNLLEERLKVPVAKYCMNGAGTHDRLVMIKHYLEEVNTLPEVVVYDVSGRSFSEGLAANSYALFFPFMDESRAVDAYLRESASPAEYWQKKLMPLSRYDDTRLGAVIRGWRSDWKNRSLKKFSAEQFQHNLDAGEFWKISFDENNLRLFDETLAFLEAKGIRVVLAGLPCVDMLNRAEPEKYEQVMQIFRSAVRRYPNVCLLDLNPEFSNQYELFGDPIHLSIAGQKAVTERLAEFLDGMIGSHRKSEAKDSPGYLANHD